MVTAQTVAGGAEHVVAARRLVVAREEVATGAVARVSIRGATE